MKRLIFCFLALLICFFAYSQERRPRRYYDFPQEKKNVIKINPLSLFLTNISLSYERIITERISLQLQGGYWIGGKVAGTTWGGISVTPEFRYYFTNQIRPEGLYGAVFGRYQQIETTYEDTQTEVQISRTGGGIAVGYQFVFGNAITWDIFVGPQYLVNSVDKVEDVDIDFGTFSGNLGIRFGTTLGYAF